MLARLNALNQKVDESRELMIAEFKEIKEEMKSLNDRVSGVEAYVSEVRMEGDLPNVINLPQAQGRHDPVVHSFNLLATSASKVSEPVSKAVEEDKEKDAEEEQVDKAQENEKEQVVVEEEEVMEEDKREKKKSRKNQRKKKEKEGGSKKSTHVEEQQVEKAQEEAEAVEEDKGKKQKKKQGGRKKGPIRMSLNHRLRDRTQGERQNRRLKKKR